MGNALGISPNVMINRIVDRKFDALNPRTAMREIPRGAMTGATVSTTPGRPTSSALCSSPGGPTLRCTW